MLTIKCDERCAHVQHFKDPIGTWRLVYCYQRTIVSIRDELPSERNSISLSDLQKGANIFLRNADVLLIKGGYPFRLCGFIEGVHIVSLLLEGGSSHMFSIQIYFGLGVGNRAENSRNGETYMVQRFREGRKFQKRTHIASSYEIDGGDDAVTSTVVSHLRTPNQGEDVVAASSPAGNHVGRGRRDSGLPYGGHGNAPERETGRGRQRGRGS